MAEVDVKSSSPWKKVVGILKINPWVIIRLMGMIAISGFLYAPQVITAIKWLPWIVAGYKAYSIMPDWVGYVILGLIGKVTG